MYVTDSAPCAIWRLQGRDHQSEVTDINRQRFLSELAKLLSFMHEEDRQRAIAAYTALFDQADDEQAMLQTLNTPLVQAVQVARAYNSGRHGDGEADGIPPYLQTIYDIGTAALSEQPIQNQADEDQFSLFDEEREAAPTYDTAPYVPQEAEVTAETPVSNSAPAEESAPEAAAAVIETVPAESEGTAPVAAAEIPAAAETEIAVPEETELPPSDIGRAAESEHVETVDEPEQELDKKVSDFLDNFTLNTEESEPLPPDTPSELAKKPRRIAVDKTLRKPRVPLLILYCLFAIPLTLALIVILLPPTVLSLAAGLLCGVTGVLGFLSIFSSFSLMCDMLVVAGISLILLAVGLLLLWLFIWLIGGAIAGIVRTAVDLGGKWCYKEVPAE